MSFTSPYVAIIDVGHGNSTVLLDNQFCFIIDCGLGSSIRNFLRQEGIKEIQNVFLSHSDQDHIGGLIGLISSNEFLIHNVYVIGDATKSTKLWDDVLFSLSKSSLSGGTKLHVSISSSEGPFQCGAIELKVASPSPYLAGKAPGNITRNNDKISSNTISASFHINWNNNSIAFLAGDIDQISLNDMVDHGVSLNTSLLVFPHHGGKSGEHDAVKFTDTICKLSQASTVIFSIGRNKFSNPRKEVVSTIRSIIPNVRIGCTQLSKNCASDLPKKIADHLLPVFSKGKASKACCTGTFIIQLGDTIEYHPKKADHFKFIYEFAPNSLCS